MILLDLTIEQRIVASIEALGRKDTAEFNKLLGTCSITTVSLVDPAFWHNLMYVLDLAILVEFQLLQNGLLFYATKHLPNVVEVLQEMANIDAAWEDCLNEMGLKKETFQDAFGLRNPIISMLMMDLPPPEQDSANERKNIMRSLIRGEFVNHKNGFVPIVDVQQP